MPLPEGFSEWEHLQDVLRQTQNRVVREAFADISEVSDDDITAPRSSLRWACLLKDDDSAVMTQLRLWMFYGILRKAKDFHPAMFATPVTTYQTMFRYKPQIKLYFAEDSIDLEPGFDPIDGEINFRLMHEDATTLTMSEVTNYANKIKTLFASGTGFIWKKGKIMGTYTDMDKGYKLQILARDRNEVKRVVEQVLDIQNHSPEWKRLKFNENDEPTLAYPTLPETKNILGKNYRMPRYRPIADVRFKYSLIHVHGRPQPIVLVDRTGYYRETVVSA